MKNNQIKHLAIGALTLFIAVPLVAAQDIVATNMAAENQVARSTEKAWAPAPVMTKEPVTAVAAEQSPLPEGNQHAINSSSEYSRLLTEKRLSELRIEVLQLKHKENQLNGMTSTGASVEDIEKELAETKEALAKMQSSSKDVAAAQEANNKGQDGVFVTRVYGLAGARSAVVYHDNNISNLQEGERLNSSIQLTKVSSNGAFFKRDNNEFFVPVTTIEHAQMKSFEREKTEPKKNEMLPPASLLDILNSNQ